MKRFFLIFITASLFTACKKETSSDNLNSSGTKSDTSNIINQPISGFGPNINDIDGNSYKTVYIGKQHWMVENLKVSKYNDGVEIPNVIDNQQWSQLTSGAWCYYNNDQENNNLYGKLYNMHVVNLNVNKNVCPIGWHVPSYAEWDTLIDYLGGLSTAPGKLKVTGSLLWQSPNDATNSSLFSATPSGLRLPLGLYSGRGSQANWMVNNSTEIKTIDQNSFVTIAFQGSNRKNTGLSIRCKRD